MTSQVKKYGFINAKLRARISKILPDEFFTRIIRAHSLQEAVQLLNNTDFEVLDEVYSKTGDLKTAELELLRKEIHLYTDIERYVSGEVLFFVKALLLRYEIDNIKQAFRLWFDRMVREREIEHIIGYILREEIVHSMKIDNIVYAEAYDQVIEALQATPYAEFFRDKKEEVLRDKTTFPVEIELDRYFFRNLLRAVEQLGPKDKQIAHRMLGIEIDLENINWLVRFKTYYKLSEGEVLGYVIPGGRSLDSTTISSSYRAEDPGTMVSQILEKGYPSFSSFLKTKGTDTYSRLRLFESILREILSKEITKVLVGYPFTIGTILVYFLLKEKEIQKIRTILNAKFYNLSEERIESAL